MRKPLRAMQWMALRNGPRYGELGYHRGPRRERAVPVAAEFNGHPYHDGERSKIRRRSINGRKRMAEVRLKVNGRLVTRQVEDRTLLVHFIRDTLGLTGTHVGCDTAQCGACTIHLDGRAVKSCSMLAAQASG